MNETLQDIMDQYRSVIGNHNTDSLWMESLLKEPQGKQWDESIRKVKKTVVTTEEYMGEKLVKKTVVETREET